MTFQNSEIYIFFAFAMLLLGMPRLNGVKSYVFFLLNAAFCLLIFNSDKYSLLILSAWILLHYLSLKIMLHTARRKAVFFFWLAATIAWFVVAKEYNWIIRAFAHKAAYHVWWLVTGYSFLLFRQIHLSVSVRDGTVKEVGLLSYLNYNLAFWTFLAGPIQRYDDFLLQSEKLSGPPPAAPEILLGLNRLVWGLIKMFVAAPLFKDHAGLAGFTTAPGLSSLLLLLVSFPAYLYINFSGYSDIVIGLARAIGFTLPENFNSPFRARNMMDFWGRWHMTLSEFFRDYLYYPLVSAASARLSIFASIVAGTVVSFLVMGVWHGNSVNFAYFGLSHGLGMAAVLCYGELLKRYLSKKTLKSYKANGFINAGMTGLCQLYVMCTFLVFQYPLSDLRRVLAAFKGAFL